MDRHVRRHSISILRDLVHEQKKFQKRTQNFPAGIATPTSSPLFDYVMESVGGGDAWRNMSVVLSPAQATSAMRSQELAKVVQKDSVAKVFVMRCRSSPSTAVR